MSKEVLTWEITPLEKRKQVEKFISRAWLPLVGLLILYLFSEMINSFSWINRQEIKPALFNVIYMVIGAVIFIWLFFLLNKFIPYESRRYRLDDSGILISKGKKKKYFLWKEFECFYPYRSYQSYPSSPEAVKLLQRQFWEAEQEIEGQIFYLKKKPSGFFSKLSKTFVVIYSEPNNSKEVSKFLAKHLPRRKMTLTTDLGLVFYQFK